MAEFPPPLYSLVYRSRARYDFTDAALNALLQKARLRNQQARLSGLLIYCEEQFLQVLEGTEPALSDLYARIQADPRHHHVRTLAYGPIRRRAFPDWRMAFLKTDATSLEYVTGAMPLAAAPGLTAHPSDELRQLLQDFARGNAQDQ